MALHISRGQEEGLNILADVIRRNPEGGLEVAKLLAERLHTYGAKMAEIVFLPVLL